MTVAVPVADPAVALMDDQFPALPLRQLPCRLDRLTLGLVDGGSSNVAFLSHRPATCAGNNMNIVSLSHGTIHLLCSAWLFVLAAVINLVAISQ
jgi:hypothetical protein